MTLEEAIKKSIRSYHEGNEATTLNEASGNTAQYTKDYFDKFETSILGDTDIESEEDIIDDETYDDDAK